MSNRYNVVYCIDSNTTLDNAILTLYKNPQSILKYTEIIYYNTPSTYPHLKYSTEQDILYITFPPECLFVTNIKNNAHCKMVIEYEDTFFIKEKKVTPDMYISPYSKLILYKKPGVTNVRITFDIFLYKTDLYSKL